MSKPIETLENQLAQWAMVLALLISGAESQAAPSNFPRPDFPAADGPILALVETNQVIYVGGLFTHIGGKARRNLAAVDSMTGIVTEWNPDPDQSVHALVSYGGAIFVGGRFSSIGGLSRPGVAAVDLRTGQATSWTTTIEDRTIEGYIASVNVLTVFAETLYVGGQAIKVGGVSLLGAVDIVNGTPHSSWQPNILGSAPSIDALAISSNAVYVGGRFTEVAFQPRTYLAALDPGTGAPLRWDPSPNALVSDLGLSTNVLYVGGRFTSIGGQTRNGLAAVDTAGTVSSWNPSSTNSNVIRALSLSGSRVYVAGSFQSIGGQSRTNLAAIDAITGQATAWKPSVTDQINALVVSAETVYVGGLLDNFFGIVSPYFAVFPPKGWSVLSQPHLVSGNFSFRLLGEEGSNYVIQATATLTNWSSVFTNTVSNGGFDYSEPATNTSPRFYRAVSGQ